LKKNQEQFVLWGGIVFWRDFLYSMCMIPIVCNKKEEWNILLYRDKKASFFQSFDWGEFQKMAGNRPIRLQWKEGNAVEAQIQAFAQKVAFGVKYLYIPRCSFVFAASTFPSLTPYISSLLAYAKQAGYAFVRIEPQEAFSVPSGYSTVATHARQPQHTCCLDISTSNDILLSGMHSKTKYNIGLAERKGVTVTEEKNSDIFWSLTKETTDRDGFVSHNEAYYRNMLALSNVHQFTAWFDGQAIASVVCIFFGTAATYLHGASSNMHRNTMAPYLLQWKAMQAAKQAGCTVYDFWGIAPEASKGEVSTTFHTFSWRVDHAFTGITRFKVGFGGYRVSYPAAFDVVLQPFVYALYRLVQRFR
jgi:lipid II:glycine glycyltransferase (peptidoglycan interpeptide bridge formation enzyme)